MRVRKDLRNERSLSNASGEAPVLRIVWVKEGGAWRIVSYDVELVRRSPTLRLIWINFVHLFMVSLLPFATAWVARTRLASSPVAFYAGLFTCVDVA
jgi:hypothetical protein